MMQTPTKRSWLRRGAAIAGLCLAWSSALGAATVWPRWNRAQTTRIQVRERLAQVAELEARVEAARHAAGSDLVSRARDRVLSRDEAPAFLREVRAQATALGAKVIALDAAESPAVPGAPAPHYDLLRYLENRRVFVAVDRAELAPAETAGRLKAIYQFQFLVVPVTAGGTEARA
jgi:hypothetical protein